MVPLATPPVNGLSKVARMSCGRNPSPGFAHRHREARAITMPKVGPRVRAYEGALAECDGPVLNDAAEGAVARLYPAQDEQREGNREWNRALEPADRCTDFSRARLASL